jgi:hypothetical protein
MNVLMELIEHIRVTKLSTWHGVCSLPGKTNSVTESA